MKDQNVKTGEMPQMLALGASQITMTTEAKEVKFKLNGTGTVTIDWGYDTPLKEATHLTVSSCSIFIRNGRLIQRRYTRIWLMNSQRKI